jgi:hypothetical protein
MKQTIKINFVDFWNGFDPKNNYFYNLLKENFEIIISDKPDYLFYSIFGQNHKNFNCTKIFYTGENVEPPLDYCDYSFSFDYLDNPRNYRLPLYLLYDGYYDLINKEINDELKNRKFCNFIVSNPNCLERNKVFEMLNKYKKVDSGGSWKNNIGFKVTDKIKFQSNYKFSIAFENSAYRKEHPGYTTEKIMEPMRVNSIPIYWGNPLIHKEFNTESFINFYDFNNLDDMVEYIIELDKNDDEYLNKLNKPWFNNYKIPESNEIDNIKSFLYKIFEK